MMHSKPFGIAVASLFAAVSLTGSHPRLEPVIQTATCSTKKGRALVEAGPNGNSLSLVDALGNTLYYSAGVHEAPALQMAAKDFCTNGITTNTVAKKLKEEIQIASVPGKREYSCVSVDGKWAVARKGFFSASLSFNGGEPVQGSMDFDYARQSAQAFCIA